MNIGEIMKGKKSDPEYVSNFITQCIQSNKNNPDEIVKEALSRIEAIDEKIKEVDKLKAERCKLQDIIHSFQKIKKPNKVEDNKILSFFKIENIALSHSICNSLKEKSLEINPFLKSIDQTKLQDVLYCIQQLQEHKVISRSGNVLIRGTRYHDYIKFVLQEDKCSQS
jgi:seryl-tRNA synthetase